MNSPYEFFTMEELSCKCGCNRMEMVPTFMYKLVSIRREAGFALYLSSAFRCPIHDASIKGGGAHITGRAVDIAIDRGKAFIVLSLALKYGMTGIGVQQKGDSRFLHLDDLTNKDISPHTGEKFPRPTIWSY